MERNLSEILASQRQMMIKRGELAPDDDEKMAAIYDRHLQDVKSWLSLQPNIDVIYISYNDILNSPEAHIENINRFLGIGLDLTAMMSAVDQTLYRQRSELLQDNLSRP